MTNLRFLSLILTVSFQTLGVAEQMTNHWQKHSDGLDRQELTPREESKHNTLFSKLSKDQSGIDFQNFLKRENIKNYLLSGAGLTVGDYDGNGLPDLFLVSQDGGNKLYRQTAPWKFEDVTNSAGVAETELWGAGSAFVDFDNDGDLDLYLCNKGAYDLLYLNQGDGTFERNDFGSGDATYRAPTMVAFSDYDRDGDLDFYRTETRLLSIKEMFDFKVEVTRNENGDLIPTAKFARDVEALGGGFVEKGTYDHLFRNESSDEVIFRDVTQMAGIRIAREHGLAAVWWDFNNDLNPDLYISNDFHTPDHLYQNKGDGTFSEITEKALPYTSWSSMGSDFADINNDGWFDYLSTDMSATTHFKQKTMMGAMSATSWFLDYLEPRQYMRNAMHLNTGTGAFSDIAYFAGLDSTDWTWAGIFGDLDNDGLVDAYFTNGIERNVQDSDLSLEMDEIKQAGGKWDEIQKIFLDSPRFKEQNLAYQNQGNLRFNDVSKDWGLADLTVSHGAVLSDLDRDGDLDLIVSNMNDPVGIYRNNSTQNKAILVSLKGTESNHFGLGSRIEATLSDGTKITRLVTSSRGYMSGVEAVTHLGVGEDETIESLKVTWPTGKIQSFANLKSGYHYRVTEGASEASTFAQEAAPDPLFKTGPAPRFQHHENDHNDFEDQPLLPNRLSRFGPAIATADINGDGLSDLFTGGAAGQISVLHLQKPDGTFAPYAPADLKADRTQEDIAAEFFDADSDGDQDLYVVSGGASEAPGSAHYADRLYLNDGAGLFTAAPADSLPEWNASGGCIAVHDYDQDGDLDLFIGARFVPRKYPTTPESALLRNDGGTFTKINSPMDQAGLITDAAWLGNDLLLACEWGPVRLYKHTPEGFVEATGPSGLSDHTGWWTSLAVGDLDHDGDLDFIAGNFGLNTKYRVDADHPATLYAADFGKTGDLQLVEAKSKGGQLLPIRGRSCSTSAMPHLLKNAPSYNAFASKTLDELYTPDALENALRFEANTLASMIFINDGPDEGRTFTATPLPTFSQLAPVMSVAISDLNGDGRNDVALGQNFNAAQRETGRMNAGLSVLLLGQKDGSLKELSARESGLKFRDDTRQLLSHDLNGDKKADLIFGVNDGAIRVLFGK